MLKQPKEALRICEKGHSYYKKSDCPTCPQCEYEKRPKEGFLSLLHAPARRALLNFGITTEEQLAKFSKSEIEEFHGIGPSSLPILQKVLKAKGLSFRQG